MALSASSSTSPAPKLNLGESSSQASSSSSGETNSQRGYQKLPKPAELNGRFAGSGDSPARIQGNLNAQPENPPVDQAGENQAPQRQVLRIARPDRPGRDVRIDIPPQTAANNGNAHNNNNPWQLKNIFTPNRRGLIEAASLGGLITTIAFSSKIPGYNRYTETNPQHIVRGVAIGGTVLNTLGLIADQCVVRFMPTKEEQRARDLALQLQERDEYRARRAANLNPVRPAERAGAPQAAGELVDRRPAVVNGGINIFEGLGQDPAYSSNPQVKDRFDKIPLSSVVKAVFGAGSSVASVDWNKPGLFVANKGALQARDIGKEVINFLKRSIYASTNFPDYKKEIEDYLNNLAITPSLRHDLATQVTEANVHCGDRVVVGLADLLMAAKCSEIQEADAKPRDVASILIFKAALKKMGDEMSKFSEAAYLSKAKTSISELTDEQKAEARAPIVEDTLYGNYQMQLALQKAGLKIPEIFRKNAYTGPLMKNQAMLDSITQAADKIVRSLHSAENLSKNSDSFDAGKIIEFLNKHDKEFAMEVLDSRLGHLGEQAREDRNTVYQTLDADTWGEAIYQAQLKVLDNRCNKAINEAYAQALGSALKGESSAWTAPAGSEEANHEGVSSAPVQAQAPQGYTHEKGKWVAPA